jgi:hypothetical protein
MSSLLDDDYNFEHWTETYANNHDETKIPKSRDPGSNVTAEELGNSLMGTTH